MIPETPFCISEKIQKKLAEYDSHLTALAEYEEFVCKGPVEWEVDFSTMSGEELKNRKGTLVRDFNHYTQSRNDAKTEVIKEIHRMIEMDVFKDDFYRKPLESLQQLTEDAGRILKQLGTTIASYHSLMEKLLVDISMVEKEKAKIVELMSDYLKEVHENLNRIDHNSTITIRERAVKMLKIQLPDWEENESFYELRLQDYIEDVTDKSITLLEENKNVQECLGTRLTTKAFMMPWLESEMYRYAFIRLKHRENTRLHGQRWRAIRVEKAFYLRLLYYLLYSIT